MKKLISFSLLVLCFAFGAASAQTVTQKSAWGYGAGDLYRDGGKANVLMTGGGTVTVSAAGDLSWTMRFIALGGGRGAGTISTSGFYDITMPAAGTVITGMCGAANTTVTAAGINLANVAGGWSALWYQLPVGSNGFVAANLRVASYVADCVIPADYVLVGTYNSEHGSIKLGTSQIVKLGDTNLPIDFYRDGAKPSAIMTGGGTITYNTARELSWTNRFIVIGGGRGTGVLSSSGYYDISQPPAGTVITLAGGALPITVTATGIPLTQWGTLFYKLPIGGNASNASRFIFVAHFADYTVTSDMIPIASYNQDDNTIRLGTGQFMRPGGSTAVSLTAGTAVSGASASSPAAGFDYAAIASYQGNGTFQVQTIATKIPANTTIMPTIFIRGYNYGSADSVNLQVSLYTYSSPANSIINTVWTNTGSIAPTSIRAGFDAAGMLNLEINWPAAAYYNRYEISAFNDGNGAHQAAWFAGWTVTNNALPATVTNIVTVTPKAAKMIGAGVPNYATTAAAIADAALLVGMEYTVTTAGAKALYVK